MATIGLGSNIASLKIQRSLSDSSRVLSSTLERLSSGIRINRASDDAAGLSISTALDADVRVFNQGIRNANDGLSALNIADGALESLGLIVTRIQELAEQSANGVYSSKQRQALDLEAQALSDEFTRIIEATEFNERKLLDGSFTEVGIQVGYGTTGRIQFDIGESLQMRYVGDGTYAAALSLNNPTASTVGELEIADINNDGHNDVVLTKYGGDSILNLFLGNGDGTFKNVTQPAYFPSIQFGQLEIYDFNGDGNLDLLRGADGANRNIMISLGNGDGTFKATTTAAVAAANQVSGMEVADFNNDGKFDIAYTTDSGTVFEVALGNGDGSFKAGLTMARPNGTGVSELDIADVDNDGIMDILVSGSLATDRIQVFRGLGNGTFTAGMSWDSNFRSGFSLGDVNGDGNQDLISSGGSPLEVFLGNGNGTFKWRTTYAVNNSPAEPFLYDSNGDGDLDIIIATNTANTFDILFGNGDGSFKAAVSTSAPASNKGFSLGDLNGDGVSDIATAEGNTLNVFIANSHVASGLPTFDILTQLSARSTLTVFKSVEDLIAKERGNIGSVQARLSVALENLRALSDNSIQARSRIIDADIAHETSELVRNQILQQVGTAVLLQANQEPNLALKLLSLS